MRERRCMPLRRQGSRKRKSLASAGAILSSQDIPWPPHPEKAEVKEARIRQLTEQQQFLCGRGIAATRWSSPQVGGDRRSLGKTKTSIPEKEYPRAR